ELDGRGEGAVRGEDDVGRAGGEVLPGGGGPGLEQHGLALCGTGQIALGAHRVVGAVVGDLLAAPELLGDLHERLRVGVAVGVVEVAAAAEVLPGPGVVGGDDVPAGAAPGEQVEGLQAAGQVDGVVVGGVLRSDQADVLR